MTVTLIHFEVEKERIRLRLEDYLSNRFTELSRMYLRDVIKAGNCQVNGRVENKGKRVSSGDFIEIELDRDRENAMRPEELAVEIIYEDNDLAVVNKPPGMLVHPTHWQKNGTLLNALSFHFNREKQNGVIRPGLVHRLDSETSGLIVVAKNPRSHRILARQFERRTVSKRYLALVDGSLANESGTIESPIGRYAEEKRWDVMPGAKPSLTKFRVIKKFKEATLLELEPITGRTNQLRIHCASMGHPIVGDSKRGGRKFERLCLHASKLTFRDPSTGQSLEFVRDNIDEQFFKDHCDSWS